ncbi:MAG TPA: hydroxyethylthiazole kinase [Bacillota bacterium]|jgi:hydroxyethylthiazole kinase|nr:hydroxyethylthiazole kinase [Bacillota bacterium]HOA36180.1 hydroxyethylthiazole kinase [Bacillota bacterium]HOJ84231.1 hydroxyethylthiazole kinase [Bacillota bacterium]HOL15916.1 hydroxyethylthiazole kinase [Bacillota bacterium]HPZ12247.1 hydroxyethylthiazole kinase [Bacillota bacterium]
MKVEAGAIWADVVKIREEAPLIHNITNYVVMNSTANALLALGASPVMAHSEEEAADMVKIARSLVINIGTLSPAWVRAMGKAAAQAKEQGVPVILDPVGAGATPYRSRTARELLSGGGAYIIRGNASEIRALVESGATTKGVDSTSAAEDSIRAARELARAHRCTVCVSGATDYIITGEHTIKVLNGHPMMPRVTGLGCTASALCGAFAAVNRSPHLAAAHAMAVMGIAGEIAAEQASGPGSLQLHFIDALYNLSLEQIERKLRVES